MFGAVGIEPNTSHSVIRHRCLLSRPFMRKVRGRSKSGHKFMDWDGAGIHFEQERYVSGSGVLCLKKDYRGDTWVSQYLTGIEIRWKSRAARLVLIQSRIE